MIQSKYTISERSADSVLTPGVFYSSYSAIPEARERDCWSWCGESTEMSVIPLQFFMIADGPKGVVRTKKLSKSSGGQSRWSVGSVDFRLLNIIVFEQWFSKRWSIHPFKYKLTVVPESNCTTLTVVFMDDFFPSQIIRKSMSSIISTMEEVYVPPSVKESSLMRLNHAVMEKFQIGLINCVDA